MSRGETYLGYGPERPCPRLRWVGFVFGVLHYLSIYLRLEVFCGTARSRATTRCTRSSPFFAKERTRRLDDGLDALCEMLSAS